ncbi:hypothetical protein JCM8547_008942 [Rhodosporidiobolus lusitaniae]
MSFGGREERTTCVAQFRSPKASDTGEKGKRRAGVLVRLEKALKAGPVEVDKLRDKGVKSLVESSILLADEHSLPFVVVIDGYRYAVFARSSTNPSNILISSFHRFENDSDLLLLLVSVFYGLEPVKDEIEKLSEALAVSFPPRAGHSPNNLADVDNPNAEEAVQEEEKDSNNILTFAYPDRCTFTCSSFSPSSTPLFSPFLLPDLPPSGPSSPLQLTALLGSGTTGRAWLLPLPSGRKLVLKVSRYGWYNGEGPAWHAEELTHEPHILSKYARELEGLAMKALGFQRGKVAMLLECGRSTPKEWNDLTLEQRTYLFLSLLRLHQTHSLSYGDIGRRNIVILPSSSTACPPSVRFIDFARAEGHSCKGVPCGELKGAWHKLGFCDYLGKEANADAAMKDAAAKVREIAKKKGLRW